MTGRDIQKSDSKIDIVVGHKEAYYEDGRNVISVIINAISVRINMPRGTVKALMSVFAVLILIAALYGISLIPSDDAKDAKSAEDLKAAGETADEEEASSASNDRDGVVSLKDYVNISSHFYYHIPENVKDIWTPDEMYAENETLCTFTRDGDLYTVRSYTLDCHDEELEDTVKNDLRKFDDMSFIDEEYIEGTYGDIFKIRFETKDEDGAFAACTGYYWWESDPKICCLEVSSDAWRDGSAEESIKDSVYRVSGGTTAPYTVDEEAWKEQQEQEAMDSLAEDAMRDHQEQEHDADHVLKP